MSTPAIVDISPLGFQWPTSDPFLFCVHHADAYPKGDGNFGPAASLEGRNIGQDFDTANAWRMYHGTTVPGFPVHPHRGFETVTVVLDGFVDHSDSHGAAGRYGEGDVQWMTAGRGLQHAEMFPLLRTDADNPLELFQIWLNLPKRSKFVEPHFKMLWSEQIPVIERKDEQDRGTSVRLIAGRYAAVDAPAPAPDSWAADPENAVAIWIVAMDADAEWLLPAGSPELQRTLYFFEGDSCTLDGQELPFYHAAVLRPDTDITIRNGTKRARFLMLQGRPIDEPVVQYGPFVMNTETEIRQTWRDYQKDNFGGWPWDRPDNVHPPDRGRFARHADGRVEEL